MSRDPQTTAEWQEAADQGPSDAAFTMLALDAALKYGLVRGGPDVIVQRCEEIIKVARDFGVTPRHDAIARLIVGVSGNAEGEGDE